MSHTDASIHSIPVLTAFRPANSSVKSPPSLAVWLAAIGIVILGGDGLYAGIASARPHSHPAVVRPMAAVLPALTQQLAAAGPMPGAATTR